MKRKMTLSIALALSLLVSLVSLPATAQGQQRQRFRADTGVVTLGPNQILRITAVNGGDSSIRVRFTQMEYSLNPKDDGVVDLYSVSSTSTFPSVTLAPGEAASMDIAAAGDSITKGVRGVVESNSRDVRVLAQIIDTDTGKVVATFTAGQDARMDAQFTN